MYDLKTATFLACLSKCLHLNTRMHACMPTYTHQFACVHLPPPCARLTEPPAVGASKLPRRKWPTTATTTTTASLCAPFLSSNSTYDFYFFEHKYIRYSPPPVRRGGSVLLHGICMDAPGGRLHESACREVNLNKQFHYIF